MPHPTISVLRSLVDSRFPASARKPGGDVESGIPRLDELLGGGLPRGLLTELVSSGPGTGGQLVQAQILATTRAGRQRVALIDAGDGFCPDAVPADALRHIVWVRARGVAPALAAADILVRDGNYAVVMLDLRGVADRELLCHPKTTWHRLHRATEESASAVLVQAALGCVPAVRHRLVLTQSFGLEALRWSREELVARMDFEVVRGHAQRMEELAG